MGPEDYHAARLVSTIWPIITEEYLLTQIDTS